MLSELAIETPYIHLNQLLKMLGWVKSGAEANLVISEGQVEVNGIVEYRKRNKIYPGFRVKYNGEEVEIKGKHGH